MTTSEPIPDRDRRLIESLRIRPIGSEAELDEATAIANRLAASSDLSPEEDDCLELLSDQIEAYEDINYPIDDVSGHEMLRFLLEQRSTTPEVFAVQIGIPLPTIRAILDGTRALEPAHVEIFAQYFFVPPDVFLEDHLA